MSLFAVESVMLENLIRGLLVIGGLLFIVVMCLAIYLIFKKIRDGVK